jgi:hypothetical protein
LPECGGRLGGPTGEAEHLGLITQPQGRFFRADKLLFTDHRGHEGNGFFMMPDPRERTG